MKKTLNVNIGSVVFTLDDDAYRALNDYYEDIRSRLHESERTGVMEDVESRTADIFREHLSTPNQVVTIDLVRRAIAIIGNPSTFGEHSRRHTPPRSEQESEPRRLYRSRDAALGGVCAGVAKYFGLDTSLVRIATVLLVFFAGMSILVYIVLWIVLPLEPRDSIFDRYRDERRRDECR